MDEDGEELKEYVVHSSCSVNGVAYASTTVEASSEDEAKLLAEFSNRDYEIDWDTCEIDFLSEDIYDMEEI